MDDGEIKNTVSQALRSDELLEASRISVTVEQGVVTLVGGVDSETKKQHAEAIARGVDGVESVVNELDVVLPLGDQRSDEEIARAALLVIRLGAPGGVKVSVDDGWVTLDGTVDAAEQGEALARAIGSLTGVRGVTNLIQVSGLQPSP